MWRVAKLITQMYCLYFHYFLKKVINKIISAVKVYFQLIYWKLWVLLTSTYLKPQSSLTCFWLSKLKKKILHSLSLAILFSITCQELLGDKGEKMAKKYLWASWDWSAPFKIKIPPQLIIWFEGCWRAKAISLQKLPDNRSGGVWLNLSIIGLSSFPPSL